MDDENREGIWGLGVERHGGVVLVGELPSGWRDVKFEVREGQMAVLNKATGERVYICDGSLHRVV